MKALEVFQYSAEALVAITFEPFFVGHRGAAGRQLGHFLFAVIDRALDWHHDLQYYHNLLAQLKRDGLVVVDPARASLPMRLTQKGVLKLSALRKRLGGGPLPRSTHYPKEASAMLTIVTFDIPERDRRKRDWLRSALKNLSFRMLQKSVWIGKIKIPDTFLADLRRFGIIDRVEILGITKQGTLKSLS